MILITRTSNESYEAYYQLAIVHPKWLCLLKQLHPEERAIELKVLSQTRWSAQSVACISVKLRFGVILVLLDQLADDANDDRALETQCITQMIDLKFVFCLTVFHAVPRDMIGVFGARS